MKTRKDNKRNASVLAIILLLVFIGIGYAALSSTLNINGTTTISKQTWDVHFENISNVTTVGGSDVVVTTPANIVELTATPENEKDDKTISFNVSFKKPGDSYSFKVKVVNDGSLAAKTNVILDSVPAAIADYVDFTVTGITADEVINGNGAYKEITITASMKNLNSLPSFEGDSISANLTARVTAEQN